MDFGSEIIENASKTGVRSPSRHGKYGNQVGELLSRSKQGSQLYYEVRWEGLDDPKQLLGRTKRGKSSEKGFCLRGNGWFLGA